jgi:hypothetical protein
VSRELSKWKIRPAGLNGRVITEGQTDGEVPRLFLMHKHSQVVGTAYREAVHTIVMSSSWTPRMMQQLDTLLSGMRDARTGLTPGQRVPSFLTLTSFHAYMILSNIYKRQADILSMPAAQLVLPSKSTTLPVLCSHASMI